MLQRYYRVGKFLLSGGTTAFVYLFVFVLLTEVFHLWYLLASVSAYFVSFFVNFFMQKIWTFENKEARAHTQMALFFGVFVLNLALNTALMYTMVDILHVHHIVSQVLVIGLLAVMNYTIYRLYIFKQPTVHTQNTL